MASANTVNRGEQAQDFKRQVKHRLIELDRTVTDLALSLGLARNTVSLAINQPGMLKRVKAKIRKELAL